MSPPPAIYTDHISQSKFPCSRYYQSLVPASRAAIREADGRRRAFPYSERHLQCLWADPATRPETCMSSESEAVFIENPGIWNLEAGPDFLGAVLRVGPERRRVVTDVEIHVRPHDWVHHGHSGDPRYARVRAHVTWFDGALPPGTLPAGCLRIALQPAMSVVPGFSFEAIDVTAFPYGTRASIPPCSAVMGKWDPEQKRYLLAAAGEERIRRKSEQLADRIRERGADQALYEEIMCALGYKHNKRPFRQLAETLDWKSLRRQGNGDPLTAYALLLGVARLLPSCSGKDWDPETRRFVRSLWNIWWKHRARWSDRILPARAWRFDGLRPANQPARRLMAVAVLATRNVAPADSFLATAEEYPDGWPDAALRALTALSGPYWSRRTGWNAPRSDKRIALIGSPRAGSIVVNVILPFLAGTRIPARVINAALNNLPDEADNGIIRRTAAHLFGPDHPPSFYKDTLRRQGLIQIFQDFCLNDRSQCRVCPLPKALATPDNTKRGDNRRSDSCKVHPFWRAG